MDKHTIPKSVRELNILIKINQDIISTLVFEDVLQAISNGMSELLNIETAAIYTIQNEKELLLGATTPPLPPGVPVEVRLASIDDHPHIKRAIQDHQPAIVDDTKSAKLSAAEQSIVELRNLKSMLYLPFVLKGDVLGVLILGTCNKARKYTEHEVNLGQTIANHLAVAIQNAKLHEDIKIHRDNLEKMVHEKTQDLKTAIEELQAANDELYAKNEIIIDQNSELKDTLQHLKETQAQLLQSEKMASLGTLTAGVAHEINNPLNFIMGAYLRFDNYFRNKPDPNFKESELLLDSIKEGVDRISTIVKSLNHFSHNNNKMDESCNINHILDNCLIILNNEIFDRINVEQNYTDDQILVKGNAADLHHALLNILTNSIQAIEGEGRISITSTTDPKTNRVKIEIEDTGKGIKQEDIDKVMEPFFTTKDPGKGAGLGLSISYRIIEEHQGEIVISSKAGKGTLVRIELPSAS
ncbi:MAG: ATP-binding protein [Tenuifilaceae bacterium]|nr:ATP-binding protein [Tenuifilaceae bacterium]